MVESTAQSNNTELQHDDQIIVLCDNKGKGIADIWWIDSGGWISEKIWKHSTKTIVIQRSEMGTTCNARMMVGYASRKFWGLAQMQKDDTPMLWEAPA